MSRPKATKLKLLLGDPGHQNPKKHRKMEPDPLPGVPEMPEKLKKWPEAVAAWHRIVGLLDGMGILTIADGGAIAQCAYLEMEVWNLAEQIDNEGRVCYTQKMDSLGNEVMEAKANPKVTQHLRILLEYRMTWGLLGLTPGDRSRLSVTDKGKSSKFGELVGVQKQAK
jgi:P27 family predicted phage terminase small subunit